MCRYIAEEKCITNVCQPGSNLKAAGYCMYSSSTMLMLTVVGLCTLNQVDP